MPSGRYVNRVWQDSNAFIQKQDVYKDATYSAQKLKLILQNTGARTYSWTPKGVDKYVHERAN